jgi:hypothetical protein
MISTCNFFHQTASVVFPIPDPVLRVRGLPNLVQGPLECSTAQGLTVWGILSLFILRTAEPTRRLVPEAERFQADCTHSHE